MRKWLEKELEHVACDYCGQKHENHTYTRRDGMTVVECPLCGLAYLNPRPRKDLIYRFYEKEYFDGTALDRGDGGVKVKLGSNIHQLTKKKIFNRRISLIREQFGNIRGKKVMEVGCATGDMLYALKSQGADVRGVEISEYAASLARKRGLDVTAGKIEEYVAGTDKTFDLVVAFEVIEHVGSPKRFLKTLAGLVRSAGGTIILDTPNYGCANRFGDDWFGFQTSFEHLYFFSMESLKRYAYENGLKVTYWETGIYDGGPGRPKSPGDRLRNRMYTFLFLLRELGISRTLKIMQNRESAFHPYGDGHTMQVVLRKE